MNISQYLLQTTCYSCGTISEPILSASGKHIKQSCGACGKYIKFIAQNTLPHIKLVRAAIWSLSMEDVVFIQSVKQEMLFEEYKLAHGEYIAYWRLYLEIRKQIIQALEANERAS